MSPSRAELEQLLRAATDMARGAEAQLRRLRRRARPDDHRVIEQRDRYTAALGQAATFARAIMDLDAGAGPCPFCETTAARTS